ncbi:MAG: carboxypeptidase regulatory-like domain-containing protein, partial [Vicinamibacterales bacterium]|nr:carboxypeptidase regulatory-like domain-containing protein [Vicinamibacterales bacterium]
EGVVVSARKEGGIMTVSVTSDAKGKFSFPRTHLPAGNYTLRTRAVGFDLVDPGPVAIAAGKETKKDLTLEKAKNLAAQLTSAEWTMSMNGTGDEKERFTHMLMSCNYCHTLGRVLMSKHDEEGLMKAMDRMVKYYADGTARSNDNRRGRAAMVQEPGREAMEKSPNWGAFQELSRKEIAAFIQRNNLNGRTAHPFELKTLPRVTGKGTRVIVTEWDMPVAGTVTHDSDLDAKGNLWYTDEAAQLLGRFNTKTYEIKEYRPPVLPEIPKGQMEGTRDIVVDLKGRPWFPVREPGNHARMARFDPATEKLDIIKEVGGQFVGLSGDGGVWAGSTKIDPETLKVVERYSYQGAKALPPGQHGGYHPVHDSKGNVFIATYRGPGGVIKIDGKTKEVGFTSVPGLKARRGRIDFKDDRFYFGEYLADKISVFDTRTGKIQRFDGGLYSTPYTASIADKKGRFYAPSNGLERFYQVDPATGEIVQYQMPTDFDTKKISIDNSGARPVLWMTNKRTARITRVEPLD